MEVSFQSSRLLEFALETNRRFLVFRGGARSTKSYSLMQYIVICALRERGKVYTICRKTLPALKATVFRDFRDIMTDAGLFDESRLNRTELTYDLNGNLLEFISVDQPQKIRGRKRDVLWCNEVNELDEEDFRQLAIRTTGRVLMDYNPSAVAGWWYDLEEQRPGEVDFMHSTYLDNPFLEDAVVRELEAYRELDPDFWNVFGLGLRGRNSTAIYPSYGTMESAGVDAHTTVGVDFGWNHPACAVRVHHLDDAWLVEQLVHESYLTTGELIERLKPMMRPGERAYCDSARPDAIAEFRAAGILAEAADKSVRAGIDRVKSRRLMFTPGSRELMQEARNYRWRQDAQGNALDEPVKIRDDGMDAMRYAINGDGSRRARGFTTTFAFVG